MQNTDTMASHFASGRRSSAREVDLDNKLLESEETLLEILGAVSGIAAVLDGNRQIIYANDEFLKLVGIGSIEPVLGKRPGEAVGCIHAGEMESGCGTSKACSVCGAVNAIIESQKTGKRTSKETMITSVAGNGKASWDLIITSSPVELRGKQFYIFSIQDVSDQKRRQNLERIFFHDILNSAGNLNGLLSLLREDTNPDETRELIILSEESSRELIEEILVHRQLRSAENGDLIVKIERISSLEMLELAVSKTARNEIARGKNLVISDQSADTDIYTDRTMLQRILVNMLKNAIEATADGGTVIAEIDNNIDTARFIVRNDHVIPEEVKARIFQRSFSTKGKGRGIGTYSIRLLAENYLNGKVGFTSSEDEGTLFFVEIPKKDWS